MTAARFLQPVDLTQPPPNLSLHDKVFCTTTPEDPKHVECRVSYIYIYIYIHIKISSNIYIYIYIYIYILV